MRYRAQHTDAHDLFIASWKIGAGRRMSGEPIERLLFNPSVFALANSVVIYFPPVGSLWKRRYCRYFFFRGRVECYSCIASKAFREQAIPCDTPELFGRPFSVCISIIVLLKHLHLCLLSRELSTRDRPAHRLLVRIHSTHAVHYGL